MEESELTNQAIAELMLEIEGPKSTVNSNKHAERKVNPLGKANKRFLGRTISTAIRHNRREKERTQANCRKKLQDLDDFHERRKSNYFYNKDAIRTSRRSRSQSLSSSRSRSRRRSSSRSRSRRRSSSRSRSRRRSLSRSRSRRRVKKLKKRHSRKRSSSRGSRSPSRSRHRSHRRKKDKKKARKQRKSHHRARRRSISSNCNRNPSPSVAISPPSELYLEHSRRMALAVAMAYGQVLNANTQKAAVKERGSSPKSDIVRELMSDGEQENSNQIVALSISSGDEAENVLTIAVSSNSESNSDSSTGSSDTESDAASSAGSCIVLDQTELDNNASDIEIVEYHDDKEKKVPEAVNKNQQMEENPALDSVDLTED